MAIIEYDEPEPPECPPGALLVPLGGKFGIADWALIDADDAPSVLPYRWHRTAGGYARRNVYGEGRVVAVYMHRALFGLAPGDKRVVDHVDGRRLDNRRSNLRIASYVENGQNRHRPARPRASSSHRGVCFVRNPKNRPPGRPWKAYARLRGTLHHLGYHATELEAAEAAVAFRREHMSHATD